MCVCDAGGTISGLRAELASATQTLIEARTSTVSVSSGCELFLRFITMTSLEERSVRTHCAVCVCVCVCVCAHKCLCVYNHKHVCCILNECIDVCIIVMQKGSCAIYIPLCFIQDFEVLRKLLIKRGIGNIAVSWLPSVCVCVCV